MRCLQVLTTPLRPTARLVAVLSGVVFAACGDGTGPGVAGSLRAAVHGTQPITDDTIYEPSPLRFASWAPPLETYDTSFTLVQGTAGADTIYFRKRPGATTRELFMVLAIPATATFVDAAGKALPPGATVRLTVKVDRNVVKLDFGPHGSIFTKKPALLYLWWQNTDLQGRRGSDLQLWYQPYKGVPWSPLTTQVSAAFTWVVAPLFHFSNYAVAY
jgi:hypothetical protein